MQYKFLCVALTAITFLFLASLAAQNSSPYWSLAGNSTASASSKLGTTNSTALKFYTNNVQRMVIGRNTGNVGIGTNNPTERMHVNSMPGKNPFRVQVNGNTKLLVHSGGGLSVGAPVQPPANGLYVAGAGLFNNRLTVSQGGIRVKITESDTGIVIQPYGGYGESQVGIIASGYGTGLIAGGYYYGVRAGGNVGISVSAIEIGMEVTSNGDGMHIKASGNTGLGSRGEQVGVEGVGSAYGVSGYAYASNGAGVSGYNAEGYGGHFISQANYGLLATTDSGAYAGVFYGNVLTTGSYVTSDKNVKQNVQDFNGAMSIIGKLRPQYYEYKTDAKYAALNLAKGNHYGLIAQDVEAILPNLVVTSKHSLTKAMEQPDTSSRFGKGRTEAKPKPESISIKAINYTELIPIIVKGMQEQDERFVQQEAENQALKDRVAKLEELILELKNGRTGSTTMTSAYLEQNTPNPVRGTTIIRYTIPENTAAARLTLTNAKGQVVKTVSLSSRGTGQVNLSTAALASGTYHYTLYVDGGQADTKRLVITR